MLAQVQLEALRSMFRAAVAARGMERLELFTWVHNHADSMSRLYIFAEDCPKRRFGLAYANLQHNYGNALMNAKGMQMRLMTGNLRRATGQPDYTRAECRAHLKRLEAVLVANGGDTVELLAQALEERNESRVVPIRSAEAVA